MALFNVYRSHFLKDEKGKVDYDKRLHGDAIETNVPGNGMKPRLINKLTKEGYEDIDYDDYGETGVTVRGEMQSHQAVLSSVPANDGFEIDDVGFFDSLSRKKS